MHGTHIRFLVLYRVVPRKRAIGILREQFFAEFTLLGDQPVMKSSKVIMAGDFDKPRDVQRAPVISRLMYLLYSFRLQQTVSEHTEEHAIRNTGQNCICHLMYLITYLNACRKWMHVVMEWMRNNKLKLTDD